MATPFQERSPSQTASYPIARRAFTGKAPCSTLSSWRLTTSGSALANQAKRLSSRLLMLLMLKVATFTKSSLSLELRLCLPKGATEFVARLTLFYRWKEMENPELKRIGSSGGRGSPKFVETASVRIDKSDKLSGKLRVALERKGVER